MTANPGRLPSVGALDIHYPENQMKLSENAVVFVENAEYVGGYRIRVKFSDRSEQVVDFGPFLNRSTNPMIRAYLEPASFLKFVISDGDLVWGDYDLCFPIADLYEANI